MGTQESAAEVTLTPVACIPYEQKGFPYPYIEGTEYYKTKLTKDKTGKIKTTTEEINPFLANHSCCDGDIKIPSTWKPMKKGTVCYEGKEITKCAGKDPRPAIFKQIAKCDGIRGNICGEIELTKLSQSKKCGTVAAGCNVASDCSGRDPNSVNKIKGGSWCYGTFGCEQSCTSIVVDKGEGTLFTVGDECRECKGEDTNSNPQLAKDCFDFNTGKSGKCSKKFGGAYCKPITH